MRQEIGDQPLALFRDPRHHSRNFERIGKFRLGVRLISHRRDLMIAPLCADLEHAAFATAPPEPQKSRKKVTLI